MSSNHAKDYHITEVVDNSGDVPSIGEGKNDHPGQILDYAGSAEKTDPKEIKLVRKLDVRMLVCADPAFHIPLVDNVADNDNGNGFGAKPILWVLNFLNIMQRSGISVAALGGLNEDLGLAGTQFSTAISVHYVSYILGQIPSNLLLTRVPPSIALAVGVATGAIITLCVDAVNDFRGLVLQRFFLGLAVAPVWPGTLYVVSSFYKRKELGTRVSILYSSNIMATALQGLIAAPIFSELGGVRGLGGWKWFFIVIGTATGLFSVISLFTLPNTPKTTWWLSPDEKQLAHDRMIADTVEKQSDVSIMQGLKQALKDKYVWTFAFMHHIHTASSGFRNFLPTLLNTLGYDTTTTLALTCPPYILASAVAVGVGLSSGRFNERTWHLTGLKCTAMVGFILGCVSMPNNTAARLVAAFLFVGWTYGVTSLTLGWLGITCGQTKEKRAAALAFVNTFASASQIWAPYLWPDSAAPRYIMPLAASAAMCMIGIVMAWIIRLLLTAQNKRIRRQDENAVLLYAY